MEDSPLSSSIVAGYTVYLLKVYIYMITIKRNMVDMTKRRIKGQSRCFYVWDVNILTCSLNDLYVNVPKNHFKWLPFARGFRMCMNRWPLTETAIRRMGPECQLQDATGITRPPVLNGSPLSCSTSSNGSREPKQWWLKVPKWQL